MCPLAASKRTPRPATEERWLRWLVDFAQRGPEEIKGQGWEASLREFAFSLGDDFIVDFEDSFDVDDAPGLAREIHEGLNRLMTEAEWEIKLRISRLLYRSGGNRHPKVRTIGPSRDVILEGLAGLLTRHWHKVRRCRADSCARTFIATKRQSYCSRRCSQRERTRRFLKQLGGPRGFSEYRHQIYARKKRKESKNPRLKVERRKPKPKERERR